MDKLKLRNKLGHAVSLLVLFLIFNLIPLSQVKALSDINLVEEDNSIFNEEYRLRNINDVHNFEEAILQIGKEQRSLIKSEGYLLKDRKKFKLISVIEKESLKLDFTIDQPLVSTKKIEGLKSK